MISALEIEIVKLMTSIVASDKVPDNIKAQAQAILSDTLHVMEQYTSETRKNCSPILQK